MIKTDLTNEVYLAHKSNYTQGRNGYQICKITPHIMGGILSAKQCCVNIFQNPNRNASANYCIGNDGDIALCVSEENRAWTSSNATNDYQAITIEVSNCENGGEWKVSEAAWNSLVKLCVDICKRYTFRLEYNGTPSGSLTEHRMFANTDCPGPFLHKKMPELATIVNSILDGGQATIEPKKEGYNFTTFVKEVQKSIGAKIDGLPGPETLSKTITVSKSKNHVHNVVRAIQKYLYYIGYIEVGPADGIAGNKFDLAVRNFQRKNGCVVDGEITAKKKTWQKLLKLI